MREQTVIPILRRNSAIYGVGGGITWDSKWESEYQETKQKSAVLYQQEPRFELLTTGRYQEITDGDHLLNTEKPYELAQAIKEFVAGF